ncbi:hypothetical protein BCV70DRAFT_107237 [Testicularia cyperi]|uniref:Uncharacterized protein n=1 Tax=Testicularia cyperi TaxID=1882483 RepID=A0A317XSB2_9BASI|nr:hypothetical protein BCV70DRAFT_107237 [Testicularia cyperi]
MAPSQLSKVSCFGFRISTQTHLSASDCLASLAQPPSLHPCSYLGALFHLWVESLSSNTAQLTFLSLIFCDHRLGAQHTQVDSARRPSLIQTHSFSSFVFCIHHPLPDSMVAGQRHNDPDLYLVRFSCTTLFFVQLIAAPLVNFVSQCHCRSPHSQCSVVRCTRVSNDSEQAIQVL